MGVIQRVAGGQLLFDGQQLRQRGAIFAFDLLLHATGAGIEAELALVLDQDAKEVVERQVWLRFLIVAQVVLDARLVGKFVDQAAN